MGHGDQVLLQLPTVHHPAPYWYLRSILLVKTPRPTRSRLQKSDHPWTINIQKDRGPCAWLDEHDPFFAFQPSRDSHHLTHSVLRSVIRVAHLQTHSPIRLVTIFRQPR